MNILIYRDVLELLQLSDILYLISQLRDVSDVMSDLGDRGDKLMLPDVGEYGLVKAGVECISEGFS